MKILHTVEFYYPSTGGAQEVVKQISERLVKLGHDVTVATTKLSERTDQVHNGVKIEEFDISGNAVRGYKGETERYKDFLKNSKFDVIMNYAAQQWATDLFFEVMGKVKGAKVFVPCGFSGLYDPMYQEYFKRMPNLLSGYDATVYLSNNYRDINFARKHGISNTHLIPNGAGEDEFLKLNSIKIRQKLGISKSDFLILDVGSHTGVKGHREAIEIIEKANIKNATLLIVGNSFGGGCTAACRIREITSKFHPSYIKNHKRLVVKSLPRSETIAAYKEADLFLFPSNIEASPIVLFEAAAAKTPYLTNDVGNSREVTGWLKGGMVLPTSFDKDGFSHAKIDESARILEKFYADRKLREKIASEGFKYWKNKFSWERIAEKYLKLYKSLLAND